jgi:hypothetical protein
MKLVGSGGQLVPHYTFDASGSIASATLPQLILPRRFATSQLLVQNLSTSAVMYLEIGSARATATITNGSVTAVTVTNAGFGFSLAPRVQFRGGGAANLSSFLGSTEPNSPPPFKPAAAHCVMTGAAPNMSVASITIDNPGAAYLVAPFVLIENDQHDANGSADPSAGAGSGIVLPTNGGEYFVNGTACTTDALAIFCATVGQKFTCKWMD